MTGQKREGQGGPKDGGPVDPITELAKGAIQLHESFATYVAAGFTEGQAMTLLCVILTATIRNQNGSSGDL